MAPPRRVACGGPVGRLPAQPLSLAASPPPLRQAAFDAKLHGAELGKVTIEQQGKACRFTGSEYGLCTGTALLDAVIARNLWKNHRILPPTSKFKANWDLFMMLLVFYNCVYIPIELFFLKAVPHRRTIVCLRLPLKCLCQPFLVKILV